MPLLRRILTEFRRKLNVGGDEPFFVVDLGKVTRQHRRWTEVMAGIQPHYVHGWDYRFHLFPL